MYYIYSLKESAPNLIETQSQNGLPQLRPVLIPSIIVKKMDARGGIEPPIRVLQTPALPLGYPAMKKAPPLRGARTTIVLGGFYENI